jgi:hypothetical protein
MVVFVSIDFINFLMKFSAFTYILAFSFFLDCFLVVYFIQNFTFCGVGGIGGFLSRAVLLREKYTS